MKIAVLIPDRGDREKFLMHLMYCILPLQTVQPDILELVDYAPKSGRKDITERYRIGYDNLRNKDLDAILFMESDDFYSPTYIEETIAAWNDAGKPPIFGQHEVLCYHIGIRAYFTFFQSQSAHAMNTLIVPDLIFKWPKDEDPFLDMHLYSLFRNEYKLWKPDSPNCIGIKHGVGLTGTSFHRERMDRFRYQDPNGEYLKSLVDPASFEFYMNQKKP